VLSGAPAAGSPSAEIARWPQNSCHAKTIWRSQASWIADHLIKRFGLPASVNAKDAADVFRADLYRQNLEPLGADLPLTSSKVEGALALATEVPTISGSMILGRNSFFDGQIYDPGQ
jgi:NitT/TauT family transport system ATP-binding protein